MNGSPPINLYEMENLKCDHCGCIYFSDVSVIKTIPKLLVGAKEDQHEVLKALRCVECGYVPNGNVFEVKPKFRIDP